MSLSAVPVANTDPLSLAAMAVADTEPLSLPDPDPDAIPELPEDAKLVTSDATEEITLDKSDATGTTTGTVPL